MTAQHPDGHDLPESGFSALLDLLTHSELMVGLFDPDDQLRWANERYSAVFLRGLALPVAFSDVLRHGARGGFGVKIDSRDIEQFLVDILPRRRALPYRAFATDLVGGSWMWMTETLGASGWLLSVASDITSLKQQEHNLRAAHADALTSARTDALTGASNRRHVVEVGTAALARAQEEGAVLTLAAIDLDHFKAINDNFGHDAGDDVLKAFVQHCRHYLRPGDLLGRLGGEEFLLMLPGASIAAANVVVDRLREGLALSPPSAIAFTFSAGLAQAVPGEPLESVLKRADLALYRAKQAGRNRNEDG